MYKCTEEQLTMISNNFMLTEFYVAAAQPRFGLISVLLSHHATNATIIKIQNMYFIFSGTNDMSLASKPIKMTHKITKDEPKTEVGSGMSAIKKA